MSSDNVQTTWSLSSRPHISEHELPKKISAIFVSPWHGSKYMDSVFSFYNKNPSFKRYARRFFYKANEALSGGATFRVGEENINFYNHFSEGRNINFIPFMQKEEGDVARIPISDLSKITRNQGRVYKDMLLLARNAWTPSDNSTLDKIRVGELTNAYYGLTSAVTQLILTVALIEWTKKYHKNLGVELDLFYAGPSLGLYTNLVASGRFDLGQMLAIITTTHSIILDQIFNDKDPTSRHVYEDRTYRYTPVGKLIFNEIKDQLNRKYFLSMGRGAILYSFEALGKNSCKVLFLEKNVVLEFDRIIKKYIHEDRIKPFDIEVEGRVMSSMALHSRASDGLVSKLGEMESLLSRFIAFNQLSNSPMVLSSFKRGVFIDLNRPEEVIEAIRNNHTEPINVPLGEKIIGEYTQSRVIWTMTDRDVLMNQGSDMIDYRFFVDHEKNPEVWLNFVESIIEMESELESSINKLPLSTKLEEWTSVQVDYLLNIFSNQFLTKITDESQSSFEDRLWQLGRDIFNFYDSNFGKFGIDYLLFEKPISSWKKELRATFVELISDKKFWRGEDVELKNISFWKRYIWRIQETRYLFQSILKGHIDIFVKSTSHVSCHWIREVLTKQMNHWIERGLIPMMINGKRFVFVSPTEPVKLANLSTRISSYFSLKESFSIIHENRFFNSRSDESIASGEYRSFSVYGRLSTLAKLALNKLEYQISCLRPSIENVESFREGVFISIGILNDVMKIIDSFLTVNDDFIEICGGLHDFLNDLDKEVFERLLKDFDCILRENVTEDLLNGQTFDDIEPSVQLAERYRKLNMNV